MEANQTTLRFWHPEQAGADVESMVAWLNGREWVHAGEILESWSIVDSESNRRWIRDLASASGGRIMSGQKGYCLTRQVTPEELGQVVWLKTQGVAMIKRYIEIMRVWHGAKGISNLTSQISKE